MAPSGEARRVLVTGAGGFVGGPVCKALSRAGFEVHPSGRNGPFAVALEPGADWRAAVDGCHAVVHLAARAHVLDETAADPLAVYRRVNRDAALALALAARDAGVERFVFMSSIGVNGASNEVPFTERDDPRPESDYAISKWEAEQALAAALSEGGTSLTVLRPPLVYGPGVKARFRQMVDWVARGVPLPLGAVDNRRSFVGVGNLADAVRATLEAPRAGGTYLIADPEAVATPELLRRIADALAVKSRLLPVPVGLLRVAGRLVGQQGAIDRLVGSLRVDAGLFTRTFNWTPPRTMSDELAELARWYRGLPS